MTTLTGLVTLELAARVASAVATAPGVESAVVCGDGGAVLGSVGSNSAPQDAALAVFVAQRADALSADGDLRGMGRLVSGSSFQQVTACWPGGEAVVMTFADTHVFAPLRRGVSAESAAPTLRTILRRYS